MRFFIFGFIEWFNYSKLLIRDVFRNFKIFLLKDFVTVFYDKNAENPWVFIESLNNGPNTFNNHYLTVVYFARFVHNIAQICGYYDNK